MLSNARNFLCRGMAFCAAAIISRIIRNVSPDELNYRYNPWHHSSAAHVRALNV
jgi:hypothetical protein